MGYAILRTSKLKSATDITQRYNHDYRIYDVINADPSKRQENVYDAIDSLNGRSYLDAYEDRVRELRIEGSQTRGVRSDAVKGIDVFLSFSREDRDHIDLDEWVQANVEWLRKEFNPPDRKISWVDPQTGEEKTKEIDNVVSVTVHLDEETPHIHAFVVPVDDRGHLNAKYYFPDRYRLIERQNDYAKAMESFGLSRGERHSVARHEERSEFYAKMLSAVHAELPEPYPGESSRDYRARANEVYQIQQSNHLREIKEKDREIVVAKSSAFEERERVAERERTIEEKERTVEEKEKELDTREEKLKDAMGVDSSADFDAFERELRRQIRAHRRFKQALAEHPDRERASKAQEEYEEMVTWQRSREVRSRPSRRRGAPGENR